MTTKWCKTRFSQLTRDAITNAAWGCLEWIIHWSFKTFQVSDAVIVMFAVTLTSPALCIDTTAWISSRCQKSVQGGWVSCRCQFVGWFIYASQKGIDIFVPILLEVKVRIEYNMPFRGVMISCQVTTGVDNFLIVAGMMMHIDALVIQSINGILVSGSQFKGLIEMSFRRYSEK